MKLKLIQTGGFAGLTKIAEENLDNHEPVLKDHLVAVFKETSPQENESLVRDKEQLFLEFNGKTLPLYQLSLNPQLTKLIAEMNTNLCYKK